MRDDGSRACRICGQEMCDDVGADDPRLNCGGDCWGCVREIEASMKRSDLPSARANQGVKMSKSPANTGDGCARRFLFLSRDQLAIRVGIHFAGVRRTRPLWSESDGFDGWHIRPLVAGWRAFYRRRR